jgi:hypothetical protein
MVTEAIETAFPLREFIQNAGFPTDALTIEEGQDPMDAVEDWLAALPKKQQAAPPIWHKFTPGLYGRTGVALAGTLMVTKKHTTHHQWIITEGKVRIWSETEGYREYWAPLHGETLPGTRRLMHVLETVVWTTFHPTTETDVAVIESQIIEPRFRLPVVVKPCLETVTAKDLDAEFRQIWPIPAGEPLSDAIARVREEMKQTRIVSQQQFAELVEEANIRDAVRDEPMPFTSP